MRSLTLSILLTAALLGSASCGRVSGPAGDDEPPVTTASPPPGAYAFVPTVTLTASEPAIIYYTTDGSEPTTDGDSAPGSVELRDIDADEPVRFFAIDAAGNREEEQSALYTVSGSGPDPVANLAASADGTDVTVSWDEVADGNQVLLVRLVGPPEQPVDGAPYAAGDDALGGEVVYRGDGTSFVDAGLLPGVAGYAAFAIDAAGAASRGSVVGVEIALPAERFALTIGTGTDTGNGTVDVTQEAPDIGVVAQHHANNSTPTQPVLELRLTNRTSRVLYVPKLVLRRAQVGDTDIPAASFTKKEGNSFAAADGALADGDSFFYVDPLPNGWAPGATRDVQLIIAGQTADTTIELELEVISNRMVIALSGFDDDRAAGGPLIDPVGPAQVGNLAIRVTGPGQDFGYRPGVFSLDGRYLYLASRNSPEITTYDLVTMGETQTARVDGEHDKSHVQQLVAGPDGRTLYALFNDGAHAYHDMGSGDEHRAQVPIHVELVAIDRVTWKELGRVRLATRSGPSDFALRGRRFALSPDGSLAVITVSGGRPGDPADDVSGEDRGSVHIVDLATLTEVDTDPGRDGTQPIALDEVPIGGGETAVFNPSWPMFADADTVLIGPTKDDAVAPNDATVVPQNVIVELDMNDYSVRGVTVGTSVRRATRVGDRILVHGGGAQIWSYDVEARTAEDIGWAGEPIALMLPSGADHIVAQGAGSAAVYRISLLDGSQDWALTATPSPSLHGLMITPY